MIDSFIKFVPEVEAVKKLLQGPTNGVRGVYLVGGAIRDRLLEKAPTDYDFVVDLEIDLPSFLEMRMIRFEKLGHEDKCSYVTVIDGKMIHLSQFKSSEKTIEDNLRNRDFTINAMAYDIFQEEFIDPFGGVEDLKANILRTVTDQTKVFSDDPLRILRWIRFYMTGPRISLVGPFESKLGSIAVERIKDEFSKLILSDRVHDVLDLLNYAGFYQNFMPEVLTMMGHHQNKYHKYDVFDHTRLVVQYCRPDPILRLAALFHDIGKPVVATDNGEGGYHFYEHERESKRIAQEIMERLKFSKEEIRRVCRLVENHMRPLECSKKGARRLVLAMEEDLHLWKDLKFADLMGGHTFGVQKIREDFTKLETTLEEIENESVKHPYKDLAINGNDLIDLGFKPGLEFGKILKGLHEKVVEDPTLNTKHILLSMVPGELVCS